MLLSELKTLIDAEAKRAKTAGVDPEVRFLILPNFPTALSIRNELVSSLDSSISDECRKQGNYIYLAEAQDEGAVFGEITERFGWGVKSSWMPAGPPTKSQVRVRAKSKGKGGANKPIASLQDIVDSPARNEMGEDDAQQ